MTLDTDRKAVQWTGGLSMRGEVLIKLFGSSEGTFRKKFDDAICLKKERGSF